MFSGIATMLQHMPKCIDEMQLLLVMEAEDRWLLQGAKDCGYWDVVCGMTLLTQVHLRFCHCPRYVLIQDN